MRHTLGLELRWEVEVYYGLVEELSSLWLHHLLEKRREFKVPPSHINNMT